MNIKYSLGNTGRQCDQVQKCKPNKTYVLDTDTIQIIPEDIRRYMLNNVSMTERAWNKSDKLIFKQLLNSIYGVGGIGANFDGDVVSRSPIYIKNVIFNDPATIVFWSDGTKTVVKCQPGDKFDPEKGLAMAITKKTMGNSGSYYNIFKKWVKEDKSDGEV
jgi:hypothetical protein